MSVARVRELKLELVVYLFTVVLISNLRIAFWSIDRTRSCSNVKRNHDPPRPEGCMGRGRLKNKHFHRKPSQATQLRQHLEMIWAFPTGLITFPSLDRLHPVREWVQTPGSSLFNFRFGPSTGIQSVQLQICCKFRKLKQVPLQRVETHISSQSSRVEIRTMNVPSVGP